MLSYGTAGDVLFLGLSIQLWLKNGWA